MKPSMILFIFVLFIIGAYHTSASWAGQVVTDADRKWAKSVLAREKDLEAEAKTDTVAILYFANKTFDLRLDPFQKGITIMLITDLSKVGQLTLVERTRIQALIDELSLSESGIVAPEASLETGKLLGAQYIVGGTFLAGERSPLKIASDILNTRATDAMDKVFSEGDMEELIRLEKDLAFKIVEALKIKLSEKQKKKLEKPMSTNLRALEYLFAGVDYSDQGKYRLARTYFEQAIKHDPGLTMAREAIMELMHLNVTATPSGTEKILTSTRQRTSTITSTGVDQRISRSVSGSGQAGAFTDVRVRW